VPDNFSQLAICCRWKDQGGGNQKGKLFAVVKRGTEVICEKDCFGIAPHDFETRSGSFAANELNSPVANDTISIEYIVGGGGGHSLHVQDLKISIATSAPGCSTSSGTSPAAVASSGYQACATPEAPAAAPNPWKLEMVGLVKKGYAELVASGLPATEARAKAVEQAKKEVMGKITKKLFAELVASGMAPNDAALKAIEQAKEHLK